MGQDTLPIPGARILVDGELITVVLATATPHGADLVVRRPDGVLGDVALTHAELASAGVPTNDAGGDGARALATMWSRWMQHAVPRIRSAVLATRPLQPFAHQDEAVFTHMLGQPRLRFLLADEPGTGKTIMTGMYLAEGTRRGLIPGRTIIVVPAHLVEKWRRDLRRYFGIQAERLTPEIARDPRDLDPRVDVWVVSVDLYTYNVDVRRKVAGDRASWSLTVFDEAHRLTPTSQYLGAAREVAARTHHLLLLTATPHRGKEHYFRGLMNLLDDTLYPFDPRQSTYDSALRPGTLSFLRRMKEDLRDLQGNPLFPPRFAETVTVDLTGPELAAYTAVMDYVDVFYDENATLARSIYGKRAASSLAAAAATIGRRHEALRGPASARGSVVVPEEFTDLGHDDFEAVEDDDAWQRAEESVIAARTKNKTEELDRIAAVTETIRAALEAGDPAKWAQTTTILSRHDIRPGHGQLLVFTEFADTARWLARAFVDAGFSVDTLEGAVGHHDRDRLQQRFLAGEFQVLVSTDAGGEGIDLQSAHVMIDWDIPWSLVRLEQRMGRLHRIGQKNPVHIYHLVAPATREGRVQEVMLTNLESAGEALSGRIFDLLDATAARAGFDYTKALLAAQASPDAPVPAIPDTGRLVAAARELVSDEDRLRTRTDTDAAMARFRDDRLEAINPVIVDGFVDTLARAQTWTLSAGPAARIRWVRSATAPLPSALGGKFERLFASDGKALREAMNAGANALEDVVVLGPTEEPFAQLVDLGVRGGEADLVRGTNLTDASSLTGYTLLLFDAEVEAHDGVRRSRRKTPILIRYSGAGAFEVAWESLMSLVPVAATANRQVPLTPAMRQDAQDAAHRALTAEAARLRNERGAWVSKAREQLDQVGYRYYEEIEDLPLEVRRTRLQQFDALKAQRLSQLEQLDAVTSTAPRLIGWANVAGAAPATELGYDPDSEKVAVSLVLAELDRLGFAVDDRQTAGVGYDLFARHKSTGEQRLVEVKGLIGDLRPVWLEQHEWAQAQQRGEDYWLYVVTGCGENPMIMVRAKDPAAQLSSGPRTIERFQIKIGDLKMLMETDQ